MAETDSKVRINKGSLAEEAISAKDLFLKKKARVEKHSIYVGDSEMEITLTALNAKDWDDLQVKHPARNKNDRDRALGFNADTFPPAAMAAIISDPEMSAEDWDEAVWSNPSWSYGERSSLFNMIFDIQGRGINVPFGDRG